MNTIYRQEIELPIAKIVDGGKTISVIGQVELTENSTVANCPNLEYFTALVAEQINYAEEIWGISKERVIEKIARLTLDEVFEDDANET